MSAAPGKFEGEPALAALAYWHMLNGGADESTNLVDWFRSPFNFDADPEALTFAAEQGYTEGEIAEALADTSYGLSISEDEQGFVWLVTYETKDDYDKEFANVDAGEGEEE